jgi:glycosyltransferase involved in cell wall biosynthesis
MIDLTVIILTHNEEKHIARAIGSVGQIAKKIFVVDSFSTDGTVSIAKQLGATVVQNKFINYSKQFQWALDHAPDAEWIMRLDADEVLEPALVREIEERLPALPPDVVGVNLNRRHVFMGRWIRHGGRFPLTLLRIFRRGKGRIEDRWMDEHLIVWDGGTVTFHYDFSDINLNDLSFFTDKHNKYATREAIDVLNKKYGLIASQDQLSIEGTSLQASLKRWLKERFYNRLPFWVGPFGYFIYRYFFQLGFLDGREGLIYHFLQGFWYRFLVEAKVEEFDRSFRLLPRGVDKLAELERLTGYSFEDSASPPHSGAVATNADISTMQSSTDGAGVVGI